MQVSPVFLLSVFAFLRIPLSLTGYSIQDGIVLVTVDEGEYLRVLDELNAYNAISVRLRKNGVFDVPNYALVYTEYERSYKEEAIDHFMHQDDFLPVIIVRGVIPDSLKAYQNILLIEGLSEVMIGIKEGSVILQRFKEYIIANADEIVTADSMANAMSNRSYDKQRTDFESALLEAACHYLHRFSKEKMNNRLYYMDLRRLARKMARSCSDSDTDFGCEQALCKCLGTFLDHNEDVLVGDTNRNEEEFWLAYSKGKAIIYDEDYYYIDDGILKRSTEELQTVMPYTMIKMELVEQGVIECNGGSTCGFTVKKMFFKAGVSGNRRRIIKLRRDKLDGLYHPDIAARRWEPCMSVCTTGNR